MGLTPGSVHIPAGDHAAKTFHAVRAELALLMSRAGMVPCDADESEQTLVLGYSGMRWIGVVHEQNPLWCEEGAKALSRACGAAASLAVFDSDDVFAHLFERGRAGPRFDFKDGRKRVHGSAALWKRYVEPGHAGSSSKVPSRAVASRSRR